MKSLRSMALLIRRGLLFLYRYFIPQPASPGEKLFVEVNSAFWKAYRTNNSSASTHKYVLVEPQSHPIIVLCNASFAAICNHARNLTPLFVFRSRGDRANQRILQSFSHCEFVWMDDWHYLLPRLRAWYSAFKAYRKLKTPEDLLNFTMDGVKFGDLAYDTILSRGYATIPTLDWRAWRELADFYLYRYIINDLIVRYKIETSIFSHTIGLLPGTFARYLLSHNIQVILRVGSNEILLNKYNHLAQVRFYPMKPEPRYFSAMMESVLHNPQDKILGLAEEYLESRLGQRVKHLAVDLAFDRNKVTYKTREEFARQYQLDPNKKNIFVLLHAFNDHPHYFESMIYQDYFVWFEKTLEIAQSVDTVNWIFKDHPAADYYKTDIDLDQIFAKQPAKHIRFLNHRADFNAISLRYLADVIVTCIGTAGMEYSSLGIPCILAGESPYSGFGFTVDPSSAAEYEEQLRKIASPMSLTPIQIKTAKVVMFFELAVTQGTRYQFCPSYDYDQIMNIKNENLWKDAATLIRKGDWTEMEKQIKTFSEFLNNADYTQLINFEKFDFLKTAIEDQ